MGLDVLEWLGLQPRNFLRIFLSILGSYREEVNGALKKKCKRVPILTNRLPLAYAYHYKPSDRSGLSCALIIMAPLILAWLDGPDPAHSSDTWMSTHECGTGPLAASTSQVPLTDHAHCHGVTEHENCNHFPLGEVLQRLAPSY